MGVFTVTQEEYENVMGKNPSSFEASKAFGLNDTRRFPVEQVSWNDAKEFCSTLSQKKGMTFRMPSEAEWEYTCRAGTRTPFHFGETISTDQANYYGDSVYGNGQKGISRKRPIDAGSFPANAFGVHDMHGNVWQWCEDFYDRDNYDNSPASDPLNTAASPYRVLRGGSWFDFPWYCRSAYRYFDMPGNRGNHVGFRVVLSTP